MNGSMDLRILRGARDLEQVYRLTHDAYVERGYIASRPNGRLIHYPHLDLIPETHVLGAWRNGRLIGTNSLTLDGPAGLHVDGTFKHEADKVRAQGGRVAGSWRIVVDHRCADGTRIVMELIRATIRLGLIVDVETCLFTFHPKHERVYQRLLNAVTIAHGEIREMFCGPAVLMQCEMESIPRRLKPQETVADGSAVGLRRKGAHPPFVRASRRWMRCHDHITKSQLQTTPRPRSPPPPPSTSLRHEPKPGTINNPRLCVPCDDPTRDVFSIK